MSDTFSIELPTKPPKRGQHPASTPSTTETPNETKPQVQPISTIAPTPQGSKSPSTIDPSTVQDFKPRGPMVTAPSQPSQSQQLTSPPTTSDTFEISLPSAPRRRRPDIPPAQSQVICSDKTIDEYDKSTSYGRSIASHMGKLNITANEFIPPGIQGSAPQPYPDEYYYHHHNTAYYPYDEEYPSAGIGEGDIGEPVPFDAGYYDVAPNPEDDLLLNIQYYTEDDKVDKDALLESTCPCCNGNPHSCLDAECSERGACICVFYEVQDMYYNEQDNDVDPDLWVPSSASCTCCNGYINRCNKDLECVSVCSCTTKGVH